MRQFFRRSSTRWTIACDTSILISFLSSSVDQTNGVLPARSAALSSMYSCTGTPIGVGGQRAELLLEPAFGQREVGGRQRRLHELGRAVLEVARSCWSPSPCPASGLPSSENRACRSPPRRGSWTNSGLHAAFHRQPRVAAGRGVGDAVLGLAGRVDVEHRGRIVVVQVLHRRSSGSALASRSQVWTTNTFGWNAAMSAELLAVLLLAAVRGAERG